MAMALTNMRAPFYFVVVTSALLVIHSTAALSYDRSCNALQVVQQELRLSRLPQDKQQRYRSTMQEFQRKTDQLFSDTRKSDRELSIITNRHVIALASARGDLQQKAVNKILGDFPELGAPENRSRLQTLAFSALMADPIFVRALQHQLINDANYDHLAASNLRTQVDAFHDLEVDQNIFAMKIPPPQAEYQRKVDVSARADLNQAKGIFGVPVVPAGVAVAPGEPLSSGGLSSRSAAAPQNTLQQNVEQSTVFRELVSAEKAARVGAVASLRQEKMEFAASQSEKVFDTPGDPVVVVTESLRNVERQLESTRLRANLDFMHLPNYLPGPEDRESFIRRNDLELPRALAETAGRASQERVNVREGYRRLLEEVPVPVESKPSPATWTQAVVDAVREKVKKTEYILEP
jgi:hypothetical protein